MIQTLRITSVIVGMLAVVLIWFSVSHGIERDVEAQDLLAAKDVIERLEDQIGKTDAPPVNTQSPLVQEAQRYANIVNPPQKPGVRPPNNRKKPNTGTVPINNSRLESTSFTVIGTCVNAEDPSASLAYIRETGKGDHWVRQKDVLGRFVVEEVLDGLIRLRNGEVLTEQRVDTPQKLSLLDDGTAGAPRVNSLPTRAAQVRTAPGRSVPTPTVTKRAGESTAAYAARLRAATATASRARTSSSRVPRSVTQRTPRPPQTPTDTKRMANIVERLNNMRDQHESNKTPEQIEEDNRTLDEITKKMMDHMEKKGAGSRNASDLDDLKRNLLSGKK